MSKLREEFEKEYDIKIHENTPLYYGWYCIWLESKLEKSPWISCEDQEPPRDNQREIYIWSGEAVKCTFVGGKYNCWVSVDGCCHNSRYFERWEFDYYMQIQAPPKEYGIC